MSLRPLCASLVAAVAAAMFALSHSALASADAAAKNEIEHLLDYIGTSSCTFVRNGSEYPATEARDHLAGKYRFAGARISTAEDFIVHLAATSSISGEPYHVRCGDTEVLSAAWLTAELERYRKAPHPRHAAH
jgi:hypothetical protein